MLGAPALTYDLTRKLAIGLTYAWGSSGPDVTPPTNTGAVVQNATPGVVSISWNEAMNTSFTPAAAAFTVSGHTVSSTAWGTSTRLDLTVTPNFVNGEAARVVGYTQPGANQARDVAGNLAVSFSGLSVTNNVAAVAPSFSVAPAIIGTPQVGVASAYTSGTFSGTPTPTSSQQWTLDAVDISGATGLTYTPVSGDAGHLLRVRQIATNTGGSANSTSASATVTAAAAGTGILPFAPNIESVVGGSAGQFIPTWTVPTQLANDTAIALDPVTSMTVYHSATPGQNFPGGGGSTVNIPSPSTTTVTVSGQSSGTTRYVSISATNASGEGDVSNEVAIVIP